MMFCILIENGKPLRGLGGFETNLGKTPIRRQAGPVYVILGKSLYCVTCSLMGTFVIAERDIFYTASLVTRSMDTRFAVSND